jgi:hypothetical protein
MKPRLVILSDLWGEKKSKWVTNYVEILKNKFEIQYYDCCQLAEINVENATQELIHQQFITGGIDKAVNNLLQLECTPVTILGFSVGGTIAYKAVLKGLNANCLFAVSATRLRYEIDFPENCKVHLYFGDQDSFVPNQNWFAKKKIKFTILKEKKHQMYIEEDFKILLCKEILES